MLDMDLRRHYLGLVARGAVNVAETTTGGVARHRSLPVANLAAGGEDRGSNRREIRARCQSTGDKPVMFVAQALALLDAAVSA